MRRSGQPDSRTPKQNLRHWNEPPDKEGHIKVRANAWDFKKRNKEYLTTPQKLADTLDDALLLVRKWMQE